MERTFLINFFHTLYFDCFPLPSAPPRSSPSPYPLNFMLSLFKKKKTKKHKKKPHGFCVGQSPLDIGLVLELADIHVMLHWRTLIFPLPLGINCK